MSLVTTASTWINDDNNSNKKRQSTMRRTIKKNPILQSEPEDYVGQEEPSPHLQPTSIDDNKKMVNDHNARVNDVLNKITAIDNNDDRMGNFNPLPNPSMNSKKDITDNTDVPKYSVPKISYLNAINQQKNINYSANDAHINNLSNYRMSYEQPLKFNPLGLNKTIDMSGVANDKVMEKINYMIHLLEESQSEKTNNVTEEFILYTFLGMFIIFVVDSFARSGKYIR
jgi:hypothetical protein